MISTIVATQKFVAIHPIIRTNATELFVYRLRNQKDLDAFLEELSALYDKKTLLRLYQHATEAPYAFLYVKLTASNRNDMFYLNLCKKLSVEHIEEHLRPDYARCENQRHGSYRKGEDPIGEGS